MERYIKLSTIIVICCFINFAHEQSFDPCENAEPGESVRGPVNCAHYIVCDEDNPRNEYCEDGLLFNPEIQDCDDAENVECGDEYDEYNSEEEEEASDEYDEENESNENEDDTDESDERDNSQEQLYPMQKSCPRNDDPTKVVFVASTRSCSEYFLCYHGLPLLMQCTNRLHFNPDTSRCDFPRNVNCRIDSPQIPTANPRCDRDIYMEVYPHPTQCDYYYFCRKGYLSIQQCPFFYYFDPMTKVCRVRDGTQC